MKNLKFPEISKKSQQSIYGAWSGSGSDLTYDGGTFDTVWLDPVDSGGGSGYDWGGTFGDGQNDYGDDSSSGGSSSGDSSSGDSSSGDSSYGSNDWGTQDFFQHYDRGDGREITLEQIGLEDDIKDTDTYKDVVEAVKTQIAEQVQAYVSENNDSTTINYDTENTYNFTFDSLALFNIGAATIKTNSEITITNFGDGSGACWSADIDVDFKDTFGDPWDVANMFQTDWDTGDPFDITGQWEEAGSGVVNTP